GSAMRVSPVAFYSDDLKEVLQLAEASADITHNHPEGIKGAVAIAHCIWMANNNFSKEDIRQEVTENYYKLDFSIDDIREEYGFEPTCQKSVPQAIECFLEGDSYEDVIRTCISLGGDSDTIACMAGGIAEAFYGVPEDIAQKAFDILEEGGIYDEMD
ncbi:MAG: ADP-ribosylglycohydrolase family protein, partial [Parasporobacterium sp.]|nr:ADP-ribosylglycohydrolase family protein [Parasporobacterium sp.]